MELIFSYSVYRTIDVAIRTHIQECLPLLWIEFFNEMVET